MRLFQNRLRLLFTENWPVEVGVLLTFLLPPVGMAWLFVLGWRQIRRTMTHIFKVPLNVTTFFMLCLMVSTIGAAIAAKKLEYGLVFAMLLGYLGLYLYAKERFRTSFLEGYQRMVIAGGVFSVLYGFLPAAIRSNEILGLLLGTKWLGGDTLDSRLVGSEYNPNYASFMVLLSFTLVLNKMLKQNKKGCRSLLKWDWLLVIFLGYGILWTEARSFIAAMLLVFVYFFFRYKRKLGYWVSGIVVVLCPFLLQIMPRSNLIDYSTAVREEIWRNSVHVWQQHPFFGTTPLGFQEAYSAFGVPVAHAHNILLAFFSEYGTLGSLGFVILILWIGLKYLFIFPCPTGKKKMIDFFLLSLPILLLTGILDHPLSSPQTSLAVIPILSFWDKYTESLPILDRVAEFGGKYLNFSIPAEYRVFAYMWAKNKVNKSKNVEHEKTGS